MRRLVLAVPLLLAAALSARAQTPLDKALKNYPPIILGDNIDTAQAPPPPSCPAPGARVEQKGGPATDYLGSVPGQPDLCRIRIDGGELQAWYGIWGNTWPGGDQARRAIQRAMAGRAGATFGFDTIAAPGVQWHDFVRNEGVERILLLGHTYRALKLSHYREGYEGNVYRSLSTVWKDMDTGMLVYGTYQHIAGAPELDGALTPAKIIPAKP